MGEINLNIDRRFKRAVAAYGNPARVSPLPSLALYDKQKFNIAIWDSTGNITEPFFETPNLNGYALRMSVCTTGVSPAVKALETLSWTWDSANQYYTGTIDLSQADLVTALAGAASLAMKLDIKIVDGSGNRTTILHEDITVIVVADIVATPSAVQTDSYLTAAESEQIFVGKRNIGPITIVADDELSEVQLSCVDGKLQEQGS